MKIIVDTCVWSMALRRKAKQSSDTAIVTQLSGLIYDSLVQMIGPVRQEIYREFLLLKYTGFFCRSQKALILSQKIT